jgi:hypothetical protein
MWKDTVERGRPQMSIWRMRIACWIPKATNTHSGLQHLLLYPRQQWLQERASLLRSTYIASIAYICKNIRAFDYLLFLNTVAIF